MVAYSAGFSVGQGGVFAKADAQVFIPEIWEATLIRYRERMMTFAQYVDRIGFAGGRGDTVKYPYIGRMRSRRKFAGQPLQFETRREGEMEMVVDRYSYVAKAIDRKVQYFSQIQLAAAYAPSMMQALMEDIEYSLLAERATFIGYRPQDHIVSNDPLSYADFLTALQIALERDIPPTELVFHVGPRHLVTLFTIPEFIQSGVYNSGNIADIRTGTVTGTILGIPVVLNHAIRPNSMQDIVLGGQDYGDIEGGEVIATPGLDPTSIYWPTQWGSDRYDMNFTPQPLQEGYTSGILTTRTSIKLAIAISPSMQQWFNNDYQEDRYAALQLYDIKTVEPRDGIVVSTDESAAIP